MKKTILPVMLLLCLGKLQAQEFMALWPQGRQPNFNGKAVTDTLYNERIWRVGNPGMYAFVVPKAENKGAAVLICPGGGYERLSHIYNGFNLAKWYNSIGVNAFVLIYRLPHQTDLVNRQLAPVQDAQRAIQLIRAKAAEWNINPAHIGVMGTSAGGHVASTLGTHNTPYANIGDAISGMSYRPDFMVLLSPVISMGKYAHPGSKKNFLGADTSAANIRAFSSELQVTDYTPPTFMVHALNDSTVKVQNSQLFFNALLDHKIHASLHVFPQGGHGIRVDDNPGSTDLWLNLLELWLKEMSFITPIPFK